MSPSKKRVRMSGTLIAGLAVCAALCAATDQEAYKVNLLIKQAAYYVGEFEKEVARQRGGEKMVWRAKEDALSRVQKLKLDHPDNPEIEKLFQRVRSALMKSKGDYTEVVTEWTAYKRNEETLRKLISEAGETEWKAVLDKYKEKVSPKPFPALSPKEVSLDDVKGTYVVLEGVEYPAHQFYGASGEYVYCGKPSEGFYFVDIAKRDWLGPYEAVKRYRRNVNSSLEDVKKWTVIGEIVDVAFENPYPGEKTVGNAHPGWEVKPIALYVPGHVMAVRDDSGESTGRYIGEEKVAAIKEGWYTVKEVPADVTPERLLEIFMTAIKEKNYKLYCDCIAPERQKSDGGVDQLRYYWDLHQERFHKEYVHAAIGNAKITVEKGFDETNAQENFFLDETQRTKLKQIGGEKVEKATVESKAYDENGKQLGTPHVHTLIRRGGGRWYVDDLAPRF
jgi:hypothetical protein